jgi:HAMP domain-containing protein
MDAVADFWAVLGALAVIVLPLALAGWLLGRSARREPFRHAVSGKMPPDEER